MQGQGERKPKRVEMRMRQGGGEATSIADRSLSDIFKLDVTTHDMMNGPKLTPLSTLSTALAPASEASAGVIIADIVLG